jgi:hypothetical protein
MKIFLFALVVAGCTNNHAVTDHRVVATACGSSAGDSFGSDQCMTDSDCGSGAVCGCAGTTFEYAHETRNLCVPAGCHVDADCGGGGYCSPSNGDCGTFYGAQLFACHTDDDQCGNDDDCTNDSGQAGYCEFVPETGHWACGYKFCAG